MQFDSRHQRLTRESSSTNVVIDTGFNPSASNYGAIKYNPDSSIELGERMVNVPRFKLKGLTRLSDQ